jgi:phosphoribosylformimino-5-aminoimidazole carboxamide ribonucleotide (ProFAR) isomerase
VTTLGDVRRLARMHLAGCIIGRALYEETMYLADALRVAAETHGVPAPPGNARRPFL